MATMRPEHDPKCDCWYDPTTGRRLAARERVCVDCGDNLRADDGCRCLAHDLGRCTWCGLDDECTVPTWGVAAGDRVCAHCANGHQRVLHFADGAAAVQGPCTCTLADDTCSQCGLAYGTARADGTTVREADYEYDRCSRCVRARCECCDTEEQHWQRFEEGRREFLADPGPPPAHWDAATTARVTAAVELERKKFDMGG